MAKANPAPAWYAVQTFPHYEDVVARGFTAHEVEVFLPKVETKVQMKGGKTRLAERSLFSNYVFIRCKMDANLHQIQRNIRGINAILGPKGNPTPLPEEEIERVRRLVASDLPVAILTASTITKGQRVRINSGPLEGVIGVVTAKKHSGKIAIVIEAFGTNVQIDDMEPSILELLEVH